MNIGSKLSLSLLRRMPDEAKQCEVVVITRARLEHVMSMAFLDGIDAAVGELREAREQASTLPTTG